MQEKVPVYGNSTFMNSSLRDRETGKDGPKNPSLLAYLSKVAFPRFGHFVAIPYFLSVSTGKFYQGSVIL